MGARTSSRGESACRSRATTPRPSRSLHASYATIGYEPVLIGGLAMGKYLMPGTPLAGEKTPDEIKRIAATLK